MLARLPEKLRVFESSKHLCTTNAGEGFYYQFVKRGTLAECTWTFVESEGCLFLRLPLSRKTAKRYERDSFTHAYALAHQYMNFLFIFYTFCF